jgi:predicted nucleotidyltransferase
MATVDDSGRRVGRDEILAAVTEALRALPFVRAAWLGGSDATGRTDRWSDLDLMVVVEDGRVEETFAAVRAAAETLSPIAHRLRMPKGAALGHEQEFASLASADPAHFLDTVVIEKSRPGWLLEPERHGTPVVLFDRDGLVKPAPFDRAAHEARMRSRLATLRESFFLFQTLVTRAVARGAAADAAAAYVAVTLRPLVEVLRMRYCPDRFDFGPRYLDRDLPPAVRAEVEALAFPGSLAAVEACRARAEALFRETLIALR